MDPIKTLQALVDVGLAAADPYVPTQKNLPRRPEGKLFILSVGKAASPMAQAASVHYGEDFEGILLAPGGYVKEVRGFEAFEGDHPLPSTGNVRVTKMITDRVISLGTGDMLLALISGGASALLCQPRGVTLAEKIRITGKLLKSGAEIGEVNRTRAAMSAVKGGRLGKLAHPAQVKTLLVSDVAGDDPAIIGSSPTGEGKIILKSDDMLAKITKAARRMSIPVSNLGSAVTGEARKVAAEHAKIAHGFYGKRPHLILSGGETSVTVTGDGIGGPNSEYALALAIALKGADGVYGLGLDTDGHDGIAGSWGPHAGAMVKPGTLADARKLGLNAKKSLNNNDSGMFFEVLGDALTTGPTFTNLNDLRMILMV